MSFITILIPVFNEEENLHELNVQITNTMKNTKEKYEILYVNDGSKDNSMDIIKQLQKKDRRIAYIDLSRNYGKEVAMAAGFDHARGDAVIILDADLQDPPELIPIMISEWKNGGYDDVYAKRISRKGESFMKKSTSWIFYRVLEKFTKVPIQRDTGDFRLLSRKAHEALRQLRENCRYTKGLISLVGFKKKAIEFERQPRFAGKTKWNYIKLLGLAIEGITSFSIMPLRFSTIFGFIISITAFIYLVIIVLKTLLFQDPVKGYPSLMSIILFMGGIQFIILGIIGEYLGRIFYETKKRPLYFVNEYYAGDHKNKKRISAH
ncbi:MAG: glycosyl hydrolase [Spirochaetes bacterium RBG_13_51_14]|nr:MAG: glycosyl hydrolase [Spirochaetes bacterium RBG_13_51_14]